MSDGALLNEIRQALGLTQQGVGRLLGISRRTAQRMDSGASSLHGNHFRILARAVYPTDPELAARLAQLGQTTLEALGIAPARTVPAARPAAAAPQPPVSAPHLVDSIVCAAAEAMNLPPRPVRDGMRAAFERARQLGLGVDAVLKGLGQDDAKGRSKPA